jgi:hypothetical protein
LAPAPAFLALAGKSVRILLCAGATATIRGLPVWFIPHPQPAESRRTLIPPLPGVGPREGIRIVGMGGVSE